MLPSQYTCIFSNQRIQMYNCTNSGMSLNSPQVISGYVFSVVLQYTGPAKAVLQPLLNQSILYFSLYYKQSAMKDKLIGGTSYGKSPLRLYQWNHYQEIMFNAKNQSTSAFSIHIAVRYRFIFVYIAQCDLFRIHLSQQKIYWAEPSY